MDKDIKEKESCNNSDCPLVTIAIPIFNAEKYLEYAIQSVINQTYSNWELLLMEDGSTDESASIAKRMTEKDHRIQYISDKKNRGLVYRLNQSIALAKGDYYARMDADDIMAITRIEKEVLHLVDNPDIDVLGSSAMLIDENNVINGSQNMGGVRDFFIHPSVMGKTTWFKSNPYDAKAVRIEDKDLWLRTQKKSQFYNIQEPLLFYRAFANVDLSQLLASNKRQRLLFKQYRKYNHSLVWGYFNVLKTYLKDIVFFLMFSFGEGKLYTRTRSRNQVPSNLCLTISDLKFSLYK